MQKAVVKDNAGKRVTLEWSGQQNNFIAWREQTYNECKEEFGKLATVVKTGVGYTIPPLVAADYEPPVADGEVALAANQMTILRLEAEKERQKEVRKMKQNEPKMFAAIWMQMGEESRQRVQNHPDYEAAEMDDLTAALIRIIRETHLTDVDGGGDEMRLQRKLKLSRGFECLVQKPGDTIGQFKSDFDHFLQVLESAGATPLTQPERALTFLNKLDPVRYGTMMVDLENGAVQGRAFPQSLAAAWTLASSWKVKSTSGAKSGERGMESVFTLADINSAPRAPTVIKPTGGARGGRGGRGDGVGRGRGASGRGGNGKFVERRTCRGCFQKGHLWRDCPDNIESDKVMVATGEEDECDEEAMYDVNLVTEDMQHVLFTHTEVLLDNQAGSGLFKNKDLLTDHSTTTPYRIGGIDSEGTPLVVSEVGSFNALQTVGYSPESCANVLSKSTLVDDGVDVDYIKASDVYTVQCTSGPPLIFSRKILSNGKKSKHYACDMADDYKVMVETVSDNSKRLTVRELKRATAAREFMANMAHSSSKDVVELLKSSPPLNCDITPRDVRNATMVWGNPTIASLKGKTKKQKSAQASTELVPRVTQREQSLQIDIFFIKRIAFLIGVLVPLGLAMCVHIKDRTFATVRDGINRFKALARGRGFDIVECRSDGEGAVEAMREQLEDDGVHLEPCGPGQHVPVVENKIKTVKERVRAYDATLPFVMTRALLILCVMFCVSRLNWLPSCQQLDRMSPMEQFSGRRLDLQRDVRCQFGDYVQATVPDPNNTMKTRTEGCIAGFPTGNLTGSVKMQSLRTSSMVTRDKFTILPMPDLVIDHIDFTAAKEGMSRGSEPAVSRGVLRMHGPAPCDGVRAMQLLHY
jgi:hypothetical protein